MLLSDTKKKQNRNQKNTINSKNNNNNNNNELSIPPLHKKLKSDVNNKKQNQNYSQECTDQPLKKKLKKDVDDLNNLFNTMKSTDASGDAIIYIRCSSKKQNEDTMHGHATQLALCVEYAEKNNLKVVDILKDIRPGHYINKLKINNVLINNKYSSINIIVADPSRLSRSPSDGTDFVMKCLNKKIVCHSVRHNISTNNNPELKLFLSYIVDAHTESQILKGRIKSMIHLKKKNGSYIGVPPYGYHLKKEINKKSGYPISVKEIDDREQKIIKLISMLYFGSYETSWYKLLEELSNNKNSTITYNLNNKTIKFDTIYYGNMNASDIAETLNNNNIMKRNKKWTTNMVSRIIKDLKDNSYNEYICEDGEYFDIHPDDNMYENDSEYMDDEEDDESEEEYDEEDDGGEEEYDDEDDGEDDDERIVRMKISELQNTIKKNKVNKNLYDNTFECEF